MEGARETPADGECVEASRERPELERETSLKPGDRCGVGERRSGEGASGVAGDLEARGEYRATSVIERFARAGEMTSELRPRSEWILADEYERSRGGTAASEAPLVPFAPSLAERGC